MGEHFASETCVWWLDVWRETLFVIEEGMEAKALLGCSWHLSKNVVWKALLLTTNLSSPKPRWEVFQGIRIRYLKQEWFCVWRQLGNTPPTGRIGAPKDYIQPITSHARALLFPGAGQQPSWSTDGHPYGGNGVLPFFSSWGYGLRGIGWMHMTCKAGREMVFGRKGTLTLRSFQLKKRRVENGEMRGNCPLITNTNGESKENRLYKRVMKRSPWSFSSPFDPSYESLQDKTEQRIVVWETKQRQLFS